MAYAIGATAPLMSKFSMVFQDVVLFNTSTMDNIRIGRKGATDEEVMEAARKAQCDEFVQRLPEGYSTIIGENGGNQSRIHSAGESDSHFLAFTGFPDCGFDRVTESFVS